MGAAMRRTGRWVSWTVVLMSCVPRDETPAAPEPGVVLFAFPTAHLSTRVPDNISTELRLGGATRRDADAWVETALTQVRLERAKGVRVTTWVEPRADGDGVGLQVRWAALPSEGWYWLSVPIGAQPLTATHRYETTADGRARFWFRVGSQPVLQHVTRCGDDFIFEFSEPLRAEARFLSDLLEVGQDGRRVDCESIADVYAMHPQDLTQQFTRLGARCKNAGDVQTYKLSAMKTPDGVPAQRADGSAAPVIINWATDGEATSRECTTWFERRLPTP